MKKMDYYQLMTEGNVATLHVYGDIYHDEERDSLAKIIDDLTDVVQINVYINSRGGEVSEGLSIYNALIRHKASVTTYCDGFACSIASVVFMAGSERIMAESSLLMIHNPWTITLGNAKDLKKQAETLETISSASIRAYMAHVKMSEDELKSLMDNETWIMPEKAVEWGFATKVETADDGNHVWRQRVFQLIVRQQEDGANQEPVPAEGDIETRVGALETQVTNMAGRIRALEEAKKPDGHKDKKSDGEGTAKSKFFDQVRRKAGKEATE
jgi:ATP-dependent Clp endopeptidase proteolytic subunit ClpP